MRTILLTLAFISFPFHSAQAYIFTPGTGLYLFQNTENIPATDVHIRRITDGPPINTFVNGRNTAPSVFPSVGITTKDSLVFTGSPGVAPGEYMAYNFTGWEDIQFSIAFSYNGVSNEDLRDPGRVFKAKYVQISGSTDFFEYDPIYIAGLSPFAYPSSDLDLFSVAGSLVVPEPNSTSLLVIFMIAWGIILSRRSRIGLYPASTTFDTLSK